MDRGAWRVQSMGSQRVRHDWVTHTPPPLLPPQNPMCFVITNWPIWRRKQDTEIQCGAQHDSWGFESCYLVIVRI